jgi:hypothetical protein
LAAGTVERLLSSTVRFQTWRSAFRVIRPEAGCKLSRVFGWIGVTAMTAWAVLILLPSPLATRPQRVMTAWVT